MNRLKHLPFAVVSLCLAASPLSLAAESGFKDLLADGMSNWRAYQKEAAPAAWSIEEGTLRLQGRGGDLISRQTYEDFDLRLEWRLGEKGNSGIFIGVSEEPAAIWQEAIEMQVLANANYPELDAKHLAGAVYEFFPSQREWLTPPGEWNQVRILKQDGQVSFFFNGHAVGELDLKSEAFKEQVAKTKFAVYPKFGTHLKGYIGFQDHGDSSGLEIRKLRIKEL